MPKIKNQVFIYNNTLGEKKKYEFECYLDPKTNRFVLFPLDAKDDIKAGIKYFIDQSRKQNSAAYNTIIYGVYLSRQQRVNGMSAPTIADFQAMFMDYLKATDETKYTYEKVIIVNFVSGLHYCLDKEFGRKSKIYRNGGEVPDGRYVWANDAGHNGNKEGLAFMARVYYKQTIESSIGTRVRYIRLDDIECSNGTLGRYELNKQGAPLLPARSADAPDRLLNAWVGNLVMPDYSRDTNIIVREIPYSDESAVFCDGLLKTLCGIDNTLSDFFQNKDLSVRMALSEYPQLTQG